MDRVISTANTPLVRTDFSDEAAWQALLTQAAKETPEGFRANVSIIDDHSLVAALPGDLARAVKEYSKHSIVLIADEKAMKIDDQTLLVVDAAVPFPSFRVSLAALWAVENNLSIANMDFEDFMNALDERGVFRGFRDAAESD